MKFLRIRRKFFLITFVLCGKVYAENDVTKQYSFPILFQTYVIRRKDNNK